jgi:subtilisin family serine protease/subtilisin-like proprotein convertase family protein
MKTSPLLFSLPLLLSVLAAQAGDTKDPAQVVENARTHPVYRSYLDIMQNLSVVAGSKPETYSVKLEGGSTSPQKSKVSGTAAPIANEISVPASQGSNSPLKGDCCPERHVVPTIEAPSIPTLSGELTKMRIRGEMRTLEIMTDQFHVRSRSGKEKVMKFQSKRDLGEVDTEAAEYETRTGDRADVVAYKPGRPRTDENKLLITKRVLVRIASGVVPSVFAKTTGAIRAQRIGFASDGMALSYKTTAEAVVAAERLRSVPGVLDAEVIVAAKHKPDYIPAQVFFITGGPEYQPFPNTDNVEHWSCGALSLCNIRNTSAYQWWANNRVDPTRPCPLNMLFLSRVDLGDFPPIEYGANNPTDDPAFRKVWGEQSDLRMPVAWENPGKLGTPPIAGAGVRVLIIDDGIRKTHPNLLNAIDPIATHHKNFFDTPPSNSPEPEDPEFDTHGTSLAGIVGGRIPIIKGITGVAPKCLMQGAVALRSFVDDLQWAEAFALGSSLVDADQDNDFLDETRTGQVAFEICLNASSESASGDAFDLVPETWLWKRAIQFGSTKTRNTGGCIYITSAGNGGWGHNNTNYSEAKNSIFQIPVGSVSEMGRQIGYSNAGANLVCVAPSSGDELPPLLNWPSSPGGSFGSRPTRKNPPLGVDDLPPDWRRLTQGVPTIKSFKEAIAPTDDNKLYDFNFGGTSASAAMVAGVAALMLEARTDLSARDVKEILLRSCRVTNDVRVTFDGKLNPTLWRMARDGRPMHDFLGAGLIDANRAVLLAKDWPKLPFNPLPPQKLDVEKDDFGSSTATRNTETGGLYFTTVANQPIPTNPALGGPGRSVEILLPSPPIGMRLEDLEVRVRFYHKRRGDLEIKLIGPPGLGWEEGRPLETVLYRPHRDDYTESRYHPTEVALRNPTDWTFSTVRYWGTRIPVNSGGNWKLVVTDMISKDRTTPKETPPAPNRPPQNILSVDDPIYVPIDNPTDIESQRLEGVGVTYHGTFEKTPGNDPPVVTLTKLRTSPSTKLTKIQLVASGFGTAQGHTIFPVTNWDFFDSSDIVPRQPSNEPREFLEYFPPAMAMDPALPDELTPWDPPPDPMDPAPPDLWPNQPLEPVWIPWLFPPPPVRGPQGGLTSQPPWAIESPDHTFITLRDPKNPNADTNFLYVRLNRRTGELGMIPQNVGKFTIGVFAESLLGMSQPKKVEVTVALPTYESWIGVNFPGVVDPAIIGFDADPDGDGIQNGVEYAMRLDPTTFDEPVPAVTVDGTDIVFTWQEDTVAVASIYSFQAQVSTDMDTWTPINSTVLSEDNFLRTLEVRFPFGDERTFVRMKAIQNPPTPGP